MFYKEHSGTQRHDFACMIGSPSGDTSSDPSQLGGVMVSCLQLGHGGVNQRFVGVNGTLVPLCSSKLTGDRVLVRMDKLVDRPHLADGVTVCGCL